MIIPEILNQPTCLIPLFKSAQIINPPELDYSLMKISASSPPILVSFPKHNNLFAQTIYDTNSKSTLIHLEGKCLDCYIREKRQRKQYPLLTEQSIQYLINCLSQAFLTLKEMNIQSRLTHLKQYSIRMDAQKRIFKLIFHEDMLSQIQAASDLIEWNELYLSPEQLDGQFVQEKSIIFSFGLLLLNICSCETGVKQVYRKNFILDENSIKQKLQIIRSQFGYSNLLVNLIEQCLNLNIKRRLCFLELVENFNRRQKEKNVRFSDLVSQYGVLSESSSISYNLIFGSPRRSSSKIGSNDSIRNKNSPNTEVSESKIAQVDKTADKKDYEKGRKKKKGLSKLEFPKMKTAGKLEEEPKDKDGKMAKEKLRQQVIQENLHIDYRGTFGERLQAFKDWSDKNAEKSSKIKESSKKKKQQILQQSPNDESAQKSVEQREAKGLKDTGKKESKENLTPYNLENSKDGETKNNLTIEISQTNINGRNTLAHEEVQTPRGFGKSMLPAHQKLEDLYFDNITTYDQIPKPITEMEYISLSQCLSAQQQFPASFKNKVGVWIEGDLYYGDFSKGRRSGLGLQIFSNEEYYYGFFESDLFSGEGFYFWNQRQYFFGKFQLGKKVWGRLEGEVRYQGGFKGNKRQGQGICWYPNGQVYVGNWLNGKREGRGKLFYPDFTIFSGNWSKGKKKGVGVFKTDLMEITGEWSNEKIDGEAQIKYQNGDYFKGKVGQFLEKQKGEYRSNSGHVFTGEFENEQPKKGQFLYSNGDKYIGQFLNGRRHGYGEYYYMHGEIYKGYWENNKKC